MTEPDTARSEVDPAVEDRSDETPLDTGRSLVMLVAVHLILIAGLPFVTGRNLDVAVGRFPDVRTVLWLLTVPALLSLIVMAAVVATNPAMQWRSERPVAESLQHLPKRLTVTVAVVLLVAVAAAARGVVDAGVGISATVLVTVLLVAVVEEFVLRTLGSRELARRGCSVRRQGVLTSIAFVPVSLAHVMTEGPTTFPVVMLTLASGPALFILTRSAGSSLIPIVVRTIVVFGLVVGRFGPDPQQRIIFQAGLVVAAIAALAGIVSVVRLADESPEATPRQQHSRKRSAALAVAALLVPVAALVVIPVTNDGLGAEADAATDSYEASLARFEQVAAADERAGVAEPCRSRLMDHGRRTEQVVVLYHGLTNCPKQYIELGEQLFDAGANVLILRAPRHGLTDKGSSDTDSVGSVDLVGRLTAHELRDYADTTVDIAQGLGEQVIASGLSMGGVLALWTAQFRPDVDRVVAVAPAISIPPVPHFLTTEFINLFSRVPNLSLPSSGMLDHAYHGESTGALAAMFLLAEGTSGEMVAAPAAAREVIVVLNPNDNQVDNEAVRGLVEDWADADGPVEMVVLPDIGLPHDVIDVDQPTGDPGVVYPILLPLIQTGSSDG